MTAPRPASGRAGPFTRLLNRIAPLAYETPRGLRIIEPAAQLSPRVGPGVSSNAPRKRGAGDFADFHAAGVDHE